MSLTNYSGLIVPSVLAISLLLNSFMNKKKYKKIVDINEKKYIEGKVKGYKVFYDTIVYFLENEKAEQSFDNFLKNMWESDYKIYLKKERNYSTWEKMFLCVKKNRETTINELISIGENKPFIS